MQRIASKDISVIVQGPLHVTAGEGGIAGCLASVARVLPEAEVIVSTWVDEDVQALQAAHPGCILVVSDDPGGIQDGAQTSNVNRQLLSTRQGLRAATRPYSLKFRADHRLTHDGLCHIGAYAPEMPPHLQLFARPLTVSTLFARDPARLPMLFHLPDLVQFGLTKDLRALWDRPLFSAAEVVRAPGDPSACGEQFILKTSMRLAPEQAYLLALMKKRGQGVHLPSPTYVDRRLLRLSEQVLLGNTLILDPAKAGVVFPQRFTVQGGRDAATLYRWEKVPDIVRLCGRRCYALRVLHVRLNRAYLCLRGWLYQRRHGA